MCDKKSLAKIIDGAERKLRHTSQRLADTPRPENVCKAHDDIFATSAAQSEALLAILACESSRLNNEGDFAVGTKGMKLLVLLRPYRWPFALLCFSPFAENIIKSILSCMAGG